MSGRKFVPTGPGGSIRKVPWCVELGALSSDACWSAAAIDHRATQGGSGLAEPYSPLRRLNFTPPKGGRSCPWRSHATHPWRLVRHVDPFPLASGDCRGRCYDLEHSRARIEYARMQRQIPRSTNCQDAQRHELERIPKGRVRTGRRGGPDQHVYGTDG